MAAISCKRNPMRAPVSRLTFLVIEIRGPPSRTHDTRRRTQVFTRGQPSRACILETYILRHVDAHTDTQQLKAKTPPISHWHLLSSELLPSTPPFSCHSPIPAAIYTLFFPHFKAQIQRYSLPVDFLQFNCVYVHNTPP